MNRAELAQRWQLRIAPLLADADSVWQDLAKHYQEPHRHYHTLDHIGACLTHLDALDGELDDPFTVELALWAHDVIYDPRAQDNEAQSAAWFRQQFAASRLSNAQHQRVETLILATIHPTEPTDPEMALLQDLDLAILGAPPELYVRYEQWIRQEYAFVPEEPYRQGRGAVLRSFLAQPAIYHNPHFQQQREQQARQNLQWALAQL